MTVEGAKMLVCNRCQNLGKAYKEDPHTPIRPTFTPSSTPSHRTVSFQPTRRKTPQLPKELVELDLAEDLAERVRKSRSKLGISQEELAKRVKQKLSVIQKIESGKMTPEVRLCRELEHELKVKLLLPQKEDEAPKNTAPSSVTLGDIVQLKDKSKQNET